MNGEGRDWPAVLIDLETLGTTPDAVVLEVAAVCFDPAEQRMGPFCVYEVAMRSPDQQMRAIGEETFMWWGDQVAKGVLMPGLHGGMTLRAAMGNLCEFLRKWHKGGGEVWSWGIDFDLGICADAMRDYQMEVPWSYAKQRDARTLCKVMGVTRDGEVMHRALDDAQAEVEAVMEALALVALAREQQGGADV
jgi:hypothetical protein